MAARTETRKALSYQNIRIIKACPCRLKVSVSPLVFWSSSIKYFLFYSSVCGIRCKDCTPVVLLGHWSWFWPSVCLQQTLRFGSPNLIMTAALNQLVKRSDKAAGTRKHTKKKTNPGAQNRNCESVAAKIRAAGMHGCLNGAESDEKPGER